MSAEPVAALRSLRGSPIPLRNVALDARAEGLLFELAVEQTYVNVEAESIEAIYTFPLPLKAVLLSFELEIGERRLAGTVVAKREASEQYETAIDAGHSAALLEQAREGLYTVNLGNLQPNESAKIRYRYAQLLDYEQGRVRLAVPTTVAPRYGRADLALAVHQAPDVDLLAHYPCTFDLELRGELARARVHSPSHALASATSDGVLRLSGAKAFSLDRDLVVLIEGLAAPVQSVLARDRDGYVCVASLTFPKQEHVRAPKAMKLVVDCSGSMGGDSIAQAREALKGVLAGLKSHDHVSLTRFGSTVDHVTERLEPATATTLARLAGRVATIDADLGGTEMKSALESVLKIPVRGLAPDVLLITDGEIWEVDAVVERVAKAKHRLFVVAVGAAPNEELARRIADVTGGACEFVTPNEDMRAAVGRLLARMGTPPSTVAEVRWPGTPTWMLGVGATVFAGDTVHVIAGFAERPSGQVQVIASGAARPIECAIPEAAAAEDALARVAAMRRLKQSSRAEAATLAEQYQLVSEYTSCVVVLERAEGEKAEGMPALRTVPHELAAGYGGVGRVMMSRCAAPVSMDAMVAPRLAMESMPRGRKELSRPADLVFSLREPSSTGDAEKSLEGRPIAAFIELLAERVRRGDPLPTTLDELRALGVPEHVLDALASLADEGYAEDEVVTAWLALQLDDGLRESIGARAQRRIARAAASAVRKRVAEVLATRGLETLRVD